MLYHQYSVPVPSSGKVTSLVLLLLLMSAATPTTAATAAAGAAAEEGGVMAARPIESVWDFPRPAVLEPIVDEVKIVHRGITVVQTSGAMRVLETSHPPTYYVPIADLNAEAGVRLEPRGGGGSFCEWKGRCTYFDLVVNGERAAGAAWAYLNPTDRVNPNQAHGWSNYGSGQSQGTGGSFGPLKDMVAFYATKVDECYVAGERARPQDGDFYGGWITSWITGGERGIKGARGTSHY